jgi:protein TonB
MDFGSWTDRRTDTLRLRRLAVGWVVGAISVTCGMSFIILTSKGVAASQEEDDGPIEVQLAKEPEPEPPPPPPPPPEAAKAAPKPRMVAPTTISDEKLQEKEPAKDLQTDEKMDEEPKEAPAVVSAAPPPPPPPVVREKPAVKKPIRLTEDMPKPVQLVSKTPDYPPEAKSAGIEGVVLVRYVIGEDGSVRDVKALKGPPELQAACVEAVKS